MIIFRADGNHEVGLGHIMRCLSIANTGYALGERCLFATANGNLSSFIEGHGHENYIFHTDYKNMVSDLEQMKELIKAKHPLAVLVDSYYVTEFYLNTLWKYCQKIGCVLVYIDDILSFAYPCDILLNYNIYGPEKTKWYQQLYRTKRMLEPQFLLGTDYAPLRKEFQDLPERIVKREAGNILISTGGSDPDHIAKSVVEYLINYYKCLTQFQFHIIIGKMNDDIAEIKRIIKSVDNVFLHINVKNMSSLMQEADVAISAAGFTLYELCATQTPAIVYALADNQAYGAKCFQANNILKFVGDVRSFGNTALSEMLIKDAVDLAEDFDERSRIVKEQRRIIDGKGTRRLLAKIIQKRKSER